MIEEITQRTEVGSLGFGQSFARGIGSYGLWLRCQTDAAISRKASPEAVYGKADSAAGLPKSKNLRLFRNGRINAAYAAILPCLRKVTTTLDMGNVCKTAVPPLYSGSSDLSYAFTKEACFC